MTLPKLKTENTVNFIIRYTNKNGGKFQNSFLKPKLAYPDKSDQKKQMNDLDLLVDVKIGNNFELKILRKCSFLYIDILL